MAASFKYVNGLNLCSPKATNSETIETKLFAAKEMLVKAHFNIVGSPFDPGAAVKVRVPIVSSKERQLQLCRVYLCKEFAVQTDIRVRDGNEAGTYLLERGHHIREDWAWYSSEKDGEHWVRLRTATERRQVELYYYYMFNSELLPAPSRHARLHISPVFTKLGDREGREFALGLQQSWLKVMEADFPHIWAFTRLGADAFIGFSKQDRGTTHFIINVSSADEADLRPLPPDAWLGVISPNGKKYRVLILTRTLSTSPPGL